MAELWQWFHLSFLEDLEDGLAHELVLRRGLDHAGPLITHDSGQVQRVDGLVRLDQEQGSLHQNKYAYK